MKYVKSNSPTVQKELSKVIHFQKFPKTENTGGGVLLFVKFQALLYKNESTKGISWKHSESFQST